MGSCGSSPKAFVTIPPIHLSCFLQASPGNMTAMPDSKAGGQSSLSPFSSTSNPSLITQITWCSLSSLSAPFPGVYLNLVAHPAFLSLVESLSNTPPASSISPFLITSSQYQETYPIWEAQCPYWAAYSHHCYFLGSLIRGKPCPLPGDP